MGTSLILKQANFEGQCVEGITKYKLISELSSIKITDVSKFINVSNGTLSSISGWEVSDFYDIPTDANIISGYSNGYGTAALVAFFDSDGTYISGVPGSSSNFYRILAENLGMTKGYFKISNIPENATKIRMCWANGGNINEKVVIDMPYIMFQKSYTD